MADRRKGPIRYAIVGLGHIAQVAMLPAFAHARRNSRVTALVSDDPAKLKALSKKSGSVVFSYDGIRQVPRAGRRRLHCSAELPSRGVHDQGGAGRRPRVVRETDGRHRARVSTDDRCLPQERVKLMIAYRLHFEEINLKAVDLVRRGRIGEPKFFNSSFAMTVRANDIRTRKEMGGGTLYDIGVYCINAARYLLQGGTHRVTAISVNSGVARLREIDETTGAILRFDDRPSRGVRDEFQFLGCRLISDRRHEGPARRRPGIRICRRPGV